MSRFITESIVPYKGTESFRFGMRLDEVKSLLKEEHVAFDQMTESHNGCTPEVPWIVLRIEDSITLCFVEGILFEAVLENRYEGHLPNGIAVGMKMKDAAEIDATLQYDDEEEDYVSDNGYWIEDDLENYQIESITVFVPEASDGETFFRYDWIQECINRYGK